MAMRKLLIALGLIMPLANFAQLKISADHRYLLTSDDKPFFWLGDTAWELFHRLSMEEAEKYLENRAAKGFTVIQAVILAELDGLNTPNFYGNRPLEGNDPGRPVEAYFRHVDRIVDKANALGLTMALLPTWGDKWNKKWGVGPEIFTPSNARVFGKFLGNRYRSKNLVWVLGGDRNCEEEEDYIINRELAKGLREGDGGRNLISYHPQGGSSSSDFFREADWIDFHMSQTGHTTESRNYTFNIKHRKIQPLKPHLDGEPRYEDHPDRFDPARYGWMDAFDARQCGYWSMLSGAFGHTYGNHNIWQFNSQKFKSVSWARTHWTVAMEHPGAFQMGLMRRFFESIPWQQLEYNPELIMSPNPEGPKYKMAALTRDGRWMVVYIPFGDTTGIKTEGLRGTRLRASWFNPRDGTKTDAGEFDKKPVQTFLPPSIGRGSDYVLLLEGIG